MCGGPLGGVPQGEEPVGAALGWDRARDAARSLAAGATRPSDATRASMDARRSARDVYSAIGFELMYRGGLCEVEPGLFSETMRFEDVAYQSLSEEGKSAVFGRLRALVNSFRRDAYVQFTVVNRQTSEGPSGRRRFFPPEAFERHPELAGDYARVLEAKLRDGRSNIRRERYLTYSTRASDPVEATRALAEMRRAAKAELGRLGAEPRPLDGLERLALIASVVRPGEPLDFDYDRDLSPWSRVTAKDYVCPDVLDFAPEGERQAFLSDGVWCQVLELRAEMASPLDDSGISRITDLPIPLVVTWTLEPEDKEVAVRTLRKKLGLSQAELTARQREAARQGWDPALSGGELETTMDDLELAIDVLTKSSEHYFYFAGFAMTHAQTREALESRVRRIESAAAVAGIPVRRRGCLVQQELLNSVIPVGNLHVRAVRDLFTSQACLFTPFTTLEIDHEGGGYYGQNRDSGNLVMLNRKLLKTPHGFISGKSGSGKSWAAKREFTNTRLLWPDDCVFILDRSGEYVPVAERAGGLVVSLGPDSRNHLNPLDLADSRGGSRRSAVAWKIDALLGLVASLRSEGDEALTQAERSAVTAAAERAYEARAARGGSPTLGDFADELAGSGGAAREAALSVESSLGRLLSGTYSFLNHETDVPLGESRLVLFDFSGVPDDMLACSYIAAIEAVRARMYANHERGAWTWLYVDEVQSLFGHAAVLGFLGRLWREGRKYGLVCTGMSQSAGPILNSRFDGAEDIVKQSGFFLVLEPDPADRVWWEKRLGLSESELEAISEGVEPGSGLLVAGPARVPVVDDWPRGNVLWDLWNTSPDSEGDGGR